MENIANILGKHNKENVGKPCRACTDFKSWVKMKNQEISDKQVDGLSASSTSAQCPLDKDELGKSTWSFLHTMAAYFPDQPTTTQQKEMSVFMKLFAKYYPCDHCARDFRESIGNNPPDTKTGHDFAKWLCNMHNEVNRKLGKPEFNCELVEERWKEGWKDGSCG